MHELGIVMEIVKRVEKVVQAEKLTHVESIVLQVGELSSVIPGYLRQCYPAAVSGTALEETKLIIETIPGNVRCKACYKVYRFLEHTKVCPFCGDENKEMLSGNEFMLKEIIGC